MKIEWIFVCEQSDWKDFFFAMAWIVTVLSGLQIAERADFLKIIHHQGDGLPLRLKGAS